MENGLLVKDVHQIQQLYKKNPLKYLDYLSCLPLDYLGEIVFLTLKPYFRFNRLLRMDRIISFINATETRCF